MTALIHIAGIPLLAHSLTVKLTPCPCSHIVVRLDGSCMSVHGHSKSNLLLAQADQHLSSISVLCNGASGKA